MSCPSCSQSFRVPLLETSEQAAPMESGTTPSPKKGFARKLGKWGCVIPGAGILLIVVIIVIVGLAFNGSSDSKLSQPMSPEQMENQLAREWAPIFDQHKQVLFDALHPFGTAKQVIVHQVKIVEWRSGEPSTNPKDIVQFVVRFTLYWQGPVTTNGYTKGAATIDLESQRMSDLQILETNGITNANINDSVKSFGTQILEDQVNKMINGN